MAGACDRPYRREIKRLIITLPPRSLKSICASVAFPAWALGHDPTLKIICASYAQDLAGKHARDSRTLMSAPFYRSCFPRTRLNPSKLAEEEFETTAGGYRLSTSVGGTLTGRGGGILILDDAIKPQDANSTLRRQSANQWYDSTFYSRLDNKKHDVIIIVAQRVHVDDIVAHVSDKERWVHISLPAIAERDEQFQLSDGRIVGRRAGEALHPAREPLDVLAATRGTIGSFLFNAQYQQAPAPAAGNMVLSKWLGSHDEAPPAGPNDRTIQSWDTAVATNDGNDWSVCTTWEVRGQTYLLIDVVRERLDFPAQKKRVVELKEKFAASTVLIEDAGSGKGLIQLLRQENKVRPIAIPPVGSKQDRVAMASAIIEARRVLLPDRAPWLEAFRAELLAFPNDKHDDQVDSMAQFLIWITTRPKPMIPSIRSLAV